ncbi:hypothetical protein [Actinoallomurus sp. CA-150999]|uniref:hypothetical protein n=1 Tax=Actinoallomurus sp. CA-150999 TaxID=3239887 RepID=UPI003D92E510
MWLTWDRVDLEARTVKVDRQITPRGMFGLPKTKRSKRVVPMPDMVADALIKHRAGFPPTRQDIAHTDGSTVRDAELVFTRANGKAGNHRDMSRASQIARACRTRSPSTHSATPTPPSRSPQARH